MLQFKDLRVSQWKEPCIGIMQKNLIEFQVQSVFYIYLTNSLYYTNLAYIKDIYILYAIDI